MKGTAIQVAAGRIREFNPLSRRRSEPTVGQPRLRILPTPPGTTNKQLFFGDPPEEGSNDQRVNLTIG